MPTGKPCRTKTRRIQVYPVGRRNPRAGVRSQFPRCEEEAEAGKRYRQLWRQVFLLHERRELTRVHAPPAIGANPSPFCVSHCVINAASVGVVTFHSGGQRMHARTTYKVEHRN